MLAMLSSYYFSLLPERLFLRLIPGAVCAGTLAVARSAGRAPGAPLPTIIVCHVHGAIQERIDDGGAGGNLLPVTCLQSRQGAVA